MDFTAFQQRYVVVMHRLQRIYRLLTKTRLPDRQALLVMKLTTIFLITGMLSVSASGIAQKISFTGNNVSLKEVFTAIHQQTGFAISYKDGILRDAAPVSVDVKDWPLAAFLDLIFKDQPLKYRVVSRTILLFRKSAPVAANSPQPAVFATVSGLVLNNNTELLTGATIMVKSSEKITLTDQSGQFHVNAQVGDRLVISYIGYVTKEVLLTEENIQKRVIVVLTPAVNNLDEAVVQAYGVTSKRLATGNIVKVSGEEIREQPVMNPLLALQGKVPGLIVQPTSGNASAPVKIELRGRNSLNENFSGEPLYIIDGVPVTVLDAGGSFRYEPGVSPGFVQAGISVTGGQSPLFGLNADDIESIEVLKDADATAIYGSRGANGVILISTRRARSGKTSVTFSTQQGITDIPHYTQLLNTQQYLQVRREAFKNDGIVPTVENAPDLMLWDTTRYTDWQKELLSTGYNSKYGLVVAGGDDRTSFRLSGQYQTQKDMLAKSGKDEVIGVMANFRHYSLDRRLTVSLNVNYLHTYVSAIKIDGQYDLPPNAPTIYNEKGELNYAAWGGAINNYYPFANLKQPNYSTTNSLTSSLNASYQLRKGLSLDVTAGYTTNNNDNDYFLTLASYNPMSFRSGTAYFGTSRISSWTVEPQVHYSGFIGKGKLDIVAGASLLHSNTRAFTAAGLLYTSDDLIYSLNNAGFQQSGDDYSEYKYAAVFGRVGYNWQNKYLVNLTGRRDGSSRFAPGKQYGNFGSMAAAWIASEESWLKKMLPSWMSFIKLRASYGITGKDNIEDYAYLSEWSRISPGNAQPLPDYDGVPPYVTIHATNQQYHWESTKKLDLGLTIGFLENRINLDIVHFRQLADDQLVPLPTPQFTGFNNVIANSLAEIQNTGWEAALNANLIQQKDISWSAGVTFTMARNKLLSYPGIEFSPYAGRYKEGYSLNSQFLLHYTGIDPLTGEYSFEDFNKDGAITSNPGMAPGTGLDDRYVILDPSPDYLGGITSGFRYKSISLNLQFIFAKQLQADPFTTNVPGKIRNVFLPDADLDKYWHKPGDQALYPKFSTMPTVTLLGSDGYYTDAAYFRLANMELAWSLPEKLLRKVRIGSGTFSFNMNNIFIITNYPGLDPNVSRLTGPPVPRVIVGRLSFTF